MSRRKHAYFLRVARSLGACQLGRTSRRARVLHARCGRVTVLDNPRASRRSSGMLQLLQRSLSLLVVLLLAGCASEATPPPSADGLQSRLLGTWLLKKAAVPGNPSGIDLRRITFTLNNWEVEQRDPATGAIVFRHGGTYRLEGDILVSSVTFAEASTANRIGVVSNSKITVEGDSFTKVGLDNPFTETWRRISPP